MRYPASEKLEIVRLVERSHLPARRTLEKLGIPRSTFNRWYDRFLTGGVDALEDRKPRPRRVWNRIPDKVREDVVDFALEHEDLTPRELAVRSDASRRMRHRCDPAGVVKHRTMTTETAIILSTMNKSLSSSLDPSNPTEHFDGLFLSCGDHFRVSGCLCCLP